MVGWFLALALATCDGRGRCTETTADRIVREQRLVCVDGRARIETRPDGSTVVVRPRVCRTREVKP